MELICLVVVSLVCLVIFLVYREIFIALFESQDFQQHIFTHCYAFEYNIDFIYVSLTFVFMQGFNVYPRQPNSS